MSIDDKPQRLLLIWN